MPGFLGTGTEFGTVQTITVTSTDHGNLAGLGDDDHTQYGAIAQNESITGVWTFANTAVMQAIEFQSDDTYDIGDAALTKRPRTIYLAGDIVCDKMFPETWVQIKEQASPGNAAANTCRIYAEDDGAGKTRLLTIWSDGSTSVIATQP